jgi:hypothetical protein
MRIVVRGWGRDEGEKVIMSTALSEAEADSTEHYTWERTYLKIYPSAVHVSSSTELRLGGRYLMRIELDRHEIAELFYKTHEGDLVQMVRSFIEEEEIRNAERRAQRQAQHAKEYEELSR